MAEGAQRIDQLFARALAAGRLSRDSSLDLPPPPALPIAPQRATAPADTANSFQIQVTGKNVNFYNFAMAHLRSVPGVQSATPQQINPGGTSYILVRFTGDIGQLAAALGARGWVTEVAGTVVKIHGSGDKPPPIPPPQPVAAATPPPATQPAAQPPKPPRTEP